MVSSVYSPSADATGLALNSLEPNTFTSAFTTPLPLEHIEKRAGEVARAESAQQLDQFLKDTRKTAAVLRARFQALEIATANLSQEITSEQTERRNETLKLIEQVILRLDQEAHERRSVEERLRKEFSMALERSETWWREHVEELQLRVQELERPRGVRALLGKIANRRRGMNGANGTGDMTCRELSVT